MEILARTCNPEVMNTERIAARLFVALGGIIWTVLAIGSATVFGTINAAVLAIQWIVPLGLSIVAFVIGWFYERVAAALLFAGAAATIVWGFIAGWEPGVWGIMAIFLLAPEIIAGVLFLAAARMQDVCAIKA